ncbi:hypothetical protein J1N35_034234 [Gossypium stocksii]|uniref:Uncharacterized protein n=1 Tax=Gossypium stocksii TaxID=47602 RepID=A0A9D3ZPW4_9ROSI|nr:hypothetical protein J1N35_034234 [Gossypium stocksii]
MASTVIDTRGVSSGEWLLQCNKGDTPFGAMTVVVITQPINNYNHYCIDPTLTSIVSKHSFSTRQLLWSVSLWIRMKAVPSNFANEIALRSQGKSISKTQYYNCCLF